MTEQMSLKRAKDICAAINWHAFNSEGLEFDEPVIDLASISLGEMLNAAEILEEKNKLALLAQRTYGGSTKMSLIPAERLVAAVYVLNNFVSSDRAICSYPISRDAAIAVGVVRIGIDREEEEE